MDASRRNTTKSIFEEDEILALILVLTRAVALKDDMSASDSDLSEASKTPAPPDHELETTLRCEVAKAQKDEVDFSLKYIRTAAENKLGLTSGFYKNHGEWNKRSKTIIEQLAAEPEPHSSPITAKTAAANSKSNKRKSDTRAPVQKKRQKTVNQDDEDDDASGDLSSPLSDVASDFEDEEPKKKPKKAPAKPRNPKPKPSSTKPSKDIVAEAEEEKGISRKDNGIPAENAAENSDGELSVLLDDEPAPKRKRKTKDSAAPKARKSAGKASTKTKPDAEDPDQAEIKRLQGWLVKCGIRKLWGKELKPYETPRAKINHLRDMLAEAGMTGRYSLEKANQIKEARELAADIEAVQEGAERWGAEDEEGARGDKDTDDAARPGARRLVRGAKNYDFLSSDGEETD